MQNHPFYITLQNGEIFLADLYHKAPHSQRRQILSEVFSLVER